MLLLPAGCKLVKNEGGGAKGTATEQKGAKLEKLAAGLWQSKLLPHLEGTAVALPELEPAIAAGLDSAGERYGYRAGSGNPWTFATRFTGRVVTANTDTRAATAAIDHNGDGTADATIQLGPVIRGTALRDALPFVSFSDFADQIEYAGFSRALNGRAFAQALEPVQREGLVGRIVTVLGVFALGSRDDAIMVTPVTLQVEAPQ